MGGVGAAPLELIPPPPFTSLWYNPSTFMVELHVQRCRIVDPSAIG